MTNNKIVLASITVIVAAGLLALSPSMIWNAQAERYDNQYGYDNNYYQDDNNYYQDDNNYYQDDNNYSQDDNRYSYDKKDQKSSQTDIQKINCRNSNINVNGVDVTEIPHDNTALGAANEGAADATGGQNGNGWGDKINFDRNLVNVCLNDNDNEQARGNVEPQPPDGVTLITCPADSNLGPNAKVTDEDLCNAATPAELCTEGDLEGVWVEEATEAACNILFTCGEGSNLGAGAKVTDEQLCNAATPAELCTEGDLEGVWVSPAATEAACNILFTCGEGSNLGAGAKVTDEQLCNAATPAELCGTETNLPGVWVLDDETEDPVDPPACFIQTATVTVTGTTQEIPGNLDNTPPAFSSTATCLDNDVATGGGFTRSGNSVVDSSKKTAMGEGWIVTGTGSGMSAGSVTAYVECLNNPLNTN